MLRRWRSLTRDEAGSTAIEYGIAAMTVLLILGAVQSVSMHLQTTFASVEAMGAPKPAAPPVANRLSASPADPTVTGSLPGRGAGSALGPATMALPRAAAPATAAPAPSASAQESLWSATQRWGRTTLTSLRRWAGG